MSKGIWGVAIAALITLISGCGSSDDSPSQSTHVVTGASQTVSGATVSTWARVDAVDTVREFGVTVPLALVQNPPAGPGSGPAGAVAVLAFPDIVKASTFFDHFELRWEPNGHPPARFMGVPHFDFDFYGISPQEVLQITAPDTAAPTLDRLPTGYTYPGVNAAVPQMGVRTFSTAELQDTQPFTRTIAAGFANGRLIFLEPMITPAVLTQHQEFTLTAPRPVTVGRETRFPNRFMATFNSGANAYELSFGEIQTVIQQRAR